MSVPFLSILDTLNWLQNALSDVTESRESARTEARWLLESLLNLSWSQILALPPETMLSEAVTQRLIGTLEQRVHRRLPLQYILQSASFCGLTLRVSKAVLIPRPETEQLVEIILDHCKPVPSKILKIADIGTGSGAIALALKASLGNRARVTATDASAAALTMASQNASHLGLEILLRLGNGLWALPPEETFDVIVSNPPYIPASEYETLQPEVRHHEPRHALLSSEAHALTFYRHFARLGGDYLNPGGLMMLELSSTTAAQVHDLFTSTPGWAVNPLIQDFSGLPRFLMAYRQEKAL